MLQRIIVPVVVSVLAVCSSARAEQFVLVDVSYTHSADTTKDSHYYVKPPADAPQDWTKPVDYSMGSVHIMVDVKTKPAGDTPTKFQICFEGTPSYACTLQSPTYTTTGRVEWDSPFKDFWYESTVDWSKGTKQIPLILKDTMNNKPAGDPKYMPTDLHVQVTLVAPGAKFAPPPAAGSGGAAAAGAGGAAAGGRGGSGGVSAGAGGGSGAAGASGAAAGGHAAAAGGGGGGGSIANPVAGRAASGAGASAGGGASGSSNAGATSPSPSTAGALGTMAGAQTGASGDGHGTDDTGCRSAGSGSGGAWSIGAALAYVASRRRRPRRARV